jgi:hypothetical protein
VFAPYLIPPTKMVNYMIATGQIQVSEDGHASAQQGENTEAAVAQQIWADQPDELPEGN